MRKSGLLLIGALSFAVGLLGIPSAVYAQVQFTHEAIQKGSWAISGGAGFTTAGGNLYDVDGDPLTTITLTPGALYFVTDGLGVGAVVGYQVQKHGNESTWLSKAGLQVAYVANSERRVLPILGAGMNFVGAIVDDRTGTGFGFVLAAGVLVLRSEHLGMTVQAAFNHDRVRPAGGGKTVTGNIFGVAIGIIGFLHYPPNRRLQA